jgi:Tfp pilus assembly protein PilO
MSNSSPKLFLGLSALAVLGGVALSYNQYSQLTAERAKVEEVKMRVDAATGVRRQLELSEERLAQLQFKLSHLEKSVADFQYIPTLLYELERYGQANGMEVLAVRPSLAPKSEKQEEANQRKPFQEMAIEIKGRGTYAEVQSFLRGLDRFPKIVAARTVSLLPRAQSGDRSVTGSPKLELTLDLRVFVFPKVDLAKPVNGTAMTTAAGEVNQNG